MTLWIGVWLLMFSDLVLPEPVKAPIVLPETAVISTPVNGIPKGLLEQAPDDISLNKALEHAWSGYSSIRNQHPLSDILVIIDFTKPSDEKRFYVFDLKQERLLYHTFVAHGRNTGLKHATKFSNQPNSHCSSLGFLLTAETYYGKHGLSLKLDGLEKNINHHARDRAVVIHSASYANQDFVDRHGRLGRSYGCPTLPQKDYSEIVNTIKEGALIFSYYPDEQYFDSSDLVF